MRRIAPIAVCLTALLIAPGMAQAACGGVKTARSSRNLAPGPEPLVIGDSVSLLAVNPLGRVGFNVNAQGCRQWRAGHAILRRKKRQGRLPRLVVMALGSNWFITREEIGRTRKLLGPKRVLALVTPRESGGRSGPDAVRMRRAARAHRNVMVIDWVRFARGHRNWFGPDALHLTMTGVRNYVACIRTSLRYAAGFRPGPNPARHPCASRP